MLTRANACAPAGMESVTGAAVQCAVGDKTSTSYWPPRCIVGRNLDLEAFEFKIFPTFFA